MKFIGKLLVMLLLVLVLSVILLYLVLQTSWAATKFGRWVSNNSQYHLSLEKIDHSWSKPWQLRLLNLKLSPDNKSASFDAQQVTLGFGWQQIRAPSRFRSLLLQNGTLSFNATTLASPIQADFLQLSNMSLNATIDQSQLSAQQVNARVIPWLPYPDHGLGENSAFELNAILLNIDGIAARQVSLEGEIHQGNLIFNNVGAEVAQGVLTGKASRVANGSWSFDDLRLSNVRLQSSATLTQFWQPFTQLPAITFKRFDLVNAHLEGPHWAFNDLNFTLKNVVLQQGNVQADDGELTLNATDIIKGQIHLVNPGVTLGLSPLGVTIKQFATGWQAGLFSTNGRWMRENQHLQLDEVAISALEYTLPSDWQQQWQRPLPSWLSEVSVAKLSANHNLLIDITPDFPFQITALNGYGNNLLLAKEHQWGLWSGALILDASNATFNKNDLRRPAMTLIANDQQITFSDLSASTKEGLLEATAIINQQGDRQSTLQLNGRSVEVNTLYNWGWSLLPLQGNGDLMLQLTGSLATGVPFKPSLNGSLQVTDSNKKSIKQMMEHGEIIDVTEQ